MKRVFIAICLQLIINNVGAEEVATVNPERHSGGLAKLPNNKIFQPSENPITLEPKTLSKSTRTLQI